MFKLPTYKVTPVAYETHVLSDTEDWGHQFVNPRSFWETGYQGRGVVVFVIDTGIDDSHPDLIGKVIHRKDFTNEDTANKDVNGHGTWCASRIAALQNGQGVIGIAPGVALVDLRVLDSSGSGDNEWVANAYRYSANVELPEPYNNWRRITSASLGGPTSIPSLKKAVKYSYNKGVIHIAAAGNSGHRTGKNTMNWPAKYEEFVIAVGALDQDKIATYSSIGEELDVVAPGSHVLGAFRGSYAYLSGTSMATPHVAAAIALLIDKYGDLITSKNAEVYLQENAKDMLEEGWDIMSGYGAVVLTRFKEGPKIEVPEEEAVPEGCLFFLKNLFK